jgi:thiamine-monophosphate kinase
MENEEKPKLTHIDELGEFGLIDHLAKHIKVEQPSTIKGIGDDAAVIKNEKAITLVSTDMYVEGVHFDMMYTPMQHLGYKCITGSISDIYAMNGIAKQVVVSLAVSSKFSLEAIDAIYSGMSIACKTYGVDLVGGDTTSSRSGLAICVTALGEADEKDIVYRNGAQEHDIICVTGDLGAAYIGLQILEREKRIYMEHPEVQPDLKGYDYVLRRQLRPEARKDVIEQLHDLDIKPTSMIDISDGLASEVMHLCKESGVGADIYEEKIPFDPSTYNVAIELNLDPTLCALSGGEDYELLFTLKGSDYEKIKNLPDFTAIGHITDKSLGCNLITKAGNSHALQAQGWKHF